VEQGTRGGRPKSWGRKVWRWFKRSKGGKGAVIHRERRSRRGGIRTPKKGGDYCRPRKKTGIKGAKIHNGDTG